MASTEPCTSALMRSGNSFRPRALELAHHLLKRAAHAARPRRLLVTPLAGPVIGDFAGARFVVHDCNPIAGFGRAVKAKHLDRHRRAGGFHALAAIVDQRTHAAPFRPRDHNIAGDGACRVGPARSRPGRVHYQASPRSPCLRPDDPDWPSDQEFRPAAQASPTACRGSCFLVADTSTSRISPPSYSTCISCWSNSV